MKSVVKSLIWLGGGVIFLLACLSAVAFFQATSEARKADQLLAIVTRLAVGKTTESEAFEDVQHFLPGPGRQAKDEAQGDYRSFIFDNINLSRLGYSQYRRFTVRLRFKGQVLVEKSAEFSVEYGCRVEVVERSTQDPITSQGPDPSHQSHYSTAPAGVDQPVAIATIIDDSSYTESLRKADWTFNLRYLAHFGGCNDARAVLPALSR